MKDGNLWFSVVPHKYVELDHHLEVGPFSYNFWFLPVSSPFLRDDEDLGRPWEVVEIFEVEIVDFSCIIFQVQDNGTVPLGFGEPCNAVDLHIFPHIQGFILYV